MPAGKLWTAAWSGEVDEVRRLIASGVDVNGHVGGFDTPLHGAAWWGREEVERVLLDAGADVTKQDALGNTCLHQVAASYRLNMARVLLEFGANRCLQMVNNGGETPFQLAKRLNKFDMAMVLRQAGNNTSDNEDDVPERQMIRYQPEGLDALCRNSKFSRKELQTMYRGFKQDCPTGIVNEETFKKIYANFFPHGDSSAYAHFVFSTFDRDADDTISFEEIVMGLSILVRGSFHEKLQWAFGLYDINGDGFISKEEMYDIVSAIYDMMGRHAVPVIEEHTARDHVERVFLKMDLDQDGVISMDEFMYTCQADGDISNSLSLFDTVL